MDTPGNRCKHVADAVPPAPIEQGAAMPEHEDTSPASEPPKRARAASIRDVARHAGVSPGTVSKVLSGMPGIAATTRERVQAASRELDYGPAELARGMFARRSFTVGLLTSDSFGRFSGPIMAGAEDSLGQGEISIIMCDSRGDLDRERDHLATLVSRRIDGLIVTGRCSNVRPPVTADLPFPVVYAHTPSTDPGDLSVMVDDEGAGRLAAEHLLEVGRRRIAHITGPEDFDAVHKRADGLRGVLDAAGVQLLGGVRTGYWSESWGRAAAEAVLAEHPDVDAIYCGSDLLARGVADALREHGRGVPDDVALVGTDNWRLIAEATRPGLTTVDLDLHRVGTRSAQALVAAIDGDRRQGEEIVPPTLVVRGSTGLPYDAADAPGAGRYHDSCIHPVAS
jgi:LacI family transcriptional regulator